MRECLHSKGKRGYTIMTGYSLHTLSQQRGGEQKAKQTEREGAAYFHTNRWYPPSPSQYLQFSNKELAALGGLIQ